MKIYSGSLKEPPGTFLHAGYLSAANENAIFVKTPIVLSALLVLLLLLKKIFRKP